jgi:hypothetical protein
MIKYIGVGLLIFLAAFLTFIALKSPDYSISREIRINAPAEQIFPYLNSAKRAAEWGPWMEADPDAKMSYSGPDEGVGSKASWEGGKQLGTGSATITESVPFSKVVTHLEYLEPMNMVQDSEYLIESAVNQSIVTWKVRGQNNFMGRLMCVFMDMDKVVGAMFEKGLANLKKLVEG